MKRDFGGREEARMVTCEPDGEWEEMIKFQSIHDGDGKLSYEYDKPCQQFA